MQQREQAPEILSRPLQRVEDILTAAFRQDGVGILESVLDEVLEELGASQVLLVRKAGTRRRLLVARRAGSVRWVGRPDKLLGGREMVETLGAARPRLLPAAPERRGRWRLIVPMPSPGARAALVADGLPPVGPALSRELDRVVEPLRVLLRTALSASSRSPSSGSLDGMDQRPSPLPPVDRLLHAAPPRERIPSEEAAACFPEIVARSSGMRELLASVREVAATQVPVLIEGESGTGKELLAAAVHRLSPRCAQPFVSENCGALPGNLVESELFGHVRGAFTGATQDRRGLVERADGGTLFLDEIGEMELHQQKKLLRVLQEREVRPLGSGDSRPVDFRLVSATHRDLEALVSGGRFREDLFYRVHVASLRIPPLRERPEDVELLVEHFNHRCSREARRPPLRITAEAMDVLTGHTWPGNVRELRNEIWRLVAESPETVRPHHLSRRVLRHAQRRSHARVVSEGRTLLDIERELLGDVIREAVRESNGNLTRAARRLGVPRSTLYRRMERYSIRREDIGTRAIEDPLAGASGPSGGGVDGQSR